MKQQTKIVVMVAITIAIEVLMERHVTGLNGPSYWTWLWRQLPAGPVYVMTLLAAAPVFLAQGVYRNSRARTWLAMILLMVGMFASELAWRGVETNPAGLGRVTEIVQSRDGTGYFLEAYILFVRDRMSIGDYLRRYPELMPGFPMHPSVRPPAAILFYLPFLRTYDSVDDAAMAAGIAVGLLATLSLPATYALVKVLTGNASAAFAAASFLAMCPGLVGFFPEFDQVYPVFTALLVIPWVFGLRHHRLVWSAAFGLMLALACLQTHGMLMLGAFLGAWSISWAWINRSRHGVRRVASAAAVAIGVFVAFYFLLWAATGFDPIGTFRVAMERQKIILAEVHRPWPLTVPWDLYDVLLGTGWISLWLTICYFLDNRQTRQEPIGTAPDRQMPQRVLCAICLFQPIVIAALHILPGEAARLYAFMFPLLLVPVGLEMSRWPRRNRMMVSFCLWLLGAAVLRNMEFI